jgi:acetylornithine deacetylase/succinyl-diaminopimelate desuccinylase-like protein
MEPYDINSLIEFLRFRSVSADRQFKPHVEACADWLLHRFKKAGLDAENHPTAVSFGIYFANRDEPILFGFPFLLSYLIFWAGMTPVCLWLADRNARP